MNIWCEHANTIKHVSERSWLSGWVILAHLAHLAQSYLSLIFSAINTYYCSWFHLTNKKICSDWRQKLGEKWPMLMTFFLTATAAITGRKSVMFKKVWKRSLKGNQSGIFGFIPLNDTSKTKLIFQNILKFYDLCVMKVKCSLSPNLASGRFENWWVPLYIPTGYTKLQNVYHYC